MKLRTAFTSSALAATAALFASGCATTSADQPQTLTSCELSPVSRVELDYSVPIRAACANYDLTTPGFAFDVDAPGDEASTQLDALATCIRAEPTVDVMLVGPGDTLWQQLVRRGVPADRIWTRSRSTYAVSEWQQDDPGLRRVSVTIAPRSLMLAEVDFAGTTASGLETAPR